MRSTITLVCASFIAVVALWALPAQMIAVAQAQTYNAASDWATTYATTASIAAATQARWAPAARGAPAK